MQRVADRAAPGDARAAGAAPEVAAATPVAMQAAPPHTSALRANTSDRIRARRTSGPSIASQPAEELVVTQNIRSLFDRYARLGDDDELELFVALCRCMALEERLATPAPAPTRKRASRRRKAA